MTSKRIAPDVTVPDREVHFFESPEALRDWLTRHHETAREVATHWVTSAKRPETRARRLATLIEHAAQGRTVPPLTSPSRPRKVPA